MHLPSTRKAVTIFAISALMISTFLAFVPNEASAATADNATTSEDASRPLAVNTPVNPASPLSAEQLQKILKDLQARNKQTTFDPKLTNFLGLTKNGEILTLQYRAVKDDQGIFHGFFRLNGNTGYLVVQRTGKGVTTCRVDMDLNLVSAATTPSGQPGVYIAPPLAETAKMLHDELLVWADIANQITSADSQAATPVRP